MPWVKLLISTIVPIIVGLIMIWIKRDDVNYDPHPVWIIGVLFVVLGGFGLLILAGLAWLYWLFL